MGLKRLWTKTVTTEKYWKQSLVHFMTHSSLWPDLGTIMMDGVADLSSGSVELDIINGMPNPVVNKLG